MAYRPLEHTADLGIEATAESLDELFEECLRAQCDAWTRLDRVAAREERSVDLGAPDLPALLVEFLGEAIYLQETEGLVLCRADVRVSRSATGWTVAGTVAGEPFDLQRHGLKTLLKAVTYHGLRVGEDQNRWVARVIFDI